jgi:hypothetical protein
MKSQNYTPVDISANDLSQISVTLDLAKLLLSNVNTPSYNLTQEQINWTNEFIKASPESFEKISDGFKNITSDGKIDLHDIPVIIKLLADIYNSESIKKGISNPNNIIAFIKYTIDVIFASKYLTLPDTEKEAVHKLIDISLDLLNMNISSVTSVLNIFKSSKCYHSFIGLFRCHK